MRYTVSMMLAVSSVARWVRHRIYFIKKDAGQTDFPLFPILGIGVFYFQKAAKSYKNLRLARFAENVSEKAGVVSQMQQKLQCAGKAKPLFLQMNQRRQTNT